MKENKSLRERVSRQASLERSHLCYPIQSTQEYYSNLQWVKKRFQECLGRITDSPAIEYTDTILNFPGCEMPVSQKTYARFMNAREKAIETLAVIEIAHEMTTPNLSSNFDKGTLNAQLYLVSSWEDFHIPSRSYVLTLASIEELEKMDKKFMSQFYARP